MRVASRHSTNTVALVVASTPFSMRKQDVDEVTQQTNLPPNPERRLERILLFNVNPGLATSIKAHAHKHRIPYVLAAIVVFAVIVAVMLVRVTSDESDSSAANRSASTISPQHATWPWENGD
ncbi:MAG: hypothetical protein KVP17_001466 [Porospora cf. gigantea B]|uniref:uncharacterized protein n=1 Tax=Porospora cf. gigantea B TaxID=2853592 RepID=UPI003571D0F1|nr:MAG: hypothetical protein KVP17_001466 [Porospora cf. gigantea B]